MAIISLVSLVPALLFAPPNACALLTVAEVSAAVGKPVTGGTTSVVNDPQSISSNCGYQAGPLMIMVQVSQFPSAEAAKKEFADELGNATQHPVPETGVGDGAFTTTIGPTIAGLMALRGPRIVGIAFVGPGAQSIPHDRVRALMVTALSR
jgi:hypothetical protein